MQSSKSQIKQDNHLSQSAGYAPVSTVAVNARCRQIPLLTVHTAGSCAAFCLPGSQVLVSRAAPWAVRLQPVLLSTIQYCLLLGQKNKGSSLLRKKVLPSCRTLSLIYFIIYSSAHSLSLHPNGSVFQRTRCSPV